MGDYFLFSVVCEYLTELLRFGLFLFRFSVAVLINNMDTYHAAHCSSEEEENRYTMSLPHISEQLKKKNLCNFNHHS